jgi:hypothetical protein
MMKKLMMTLVAVALLAVPAAQAESQSKMSKAMKPVAQAGSKMTKAVKSMVKSDAPDKMKVTDKAAGDKTVAAETTCVMPEPTADHAWLKQMVGQWKSTTEAMMEPGKAPVTSTGTETVKELGGFWVVSDIQGTMMNKPFQGMMTLGFDDSKKQYVGTWVDSCTGKLWNYTGKKAGNTLTLESEGECPMKPGVQTRFKDVVEMKTPEHRVMTSYMQGEDGQWVKMMTINAHKVADAKAAH